MYWKVSNVFYDIGTDRRLHGAESLQIGNTVKRDERRWVTGWSQECMGRLQQNEVGTNLSGKKYENEIVDRLRGAD